MNKEVSIIPLSYGNYVSLEDYMDLKKQLEEKNKIIYETINLVKGKVYQIADDYYDYIEKGVCFQDEDLDELLEILERGKDE